MTTVLITGANRGIGLEFARQYLEDGWQVIGCCRRPQQASDLQALARRYNHLHIYPLDVADHGQVDGLAQQLRNQAIDVLINNAGVYGDQPAQGLGQLDYQRWLEVLQINCLGPVKMSEAFLPHVARSQHRLIVALSSKMGSISDNTSGGSILYRSSKAALNAAMKSISIDLISQGIGVLIFHPGWVKTDMGGPNALISPSESVSGMRRIISSFKIADSGSFVDYKGQPIAW